jgi:hypothetical protein
MSAEAAHPLVASDATEEARLDALDAEALLREVRELALERFPCDRRTLLLFFEELDRRLGAAPADASAEAGDERPAGSFADLLTRLEELLEALLVGEAHGLRRR